MFLFVLHMKWNEVKAPQDPACEEIKTHLVSIGFPEDILDDLKEEDLSVQERQTGTIAANGLSDQ